MQLAHDAPLFPPGLPRLAAICAAQNISREPCPTLHGRSRKELVRCGLALSVNTRIIKTRHLTSVHAVACPSFAHTVTEPNRISPPANSGKIGNGRSGVYGSYVAVRSSYSLLRDQSCGVAKQPLCWHLVKADGPVCTCAPLGSCDPHLCLAGETGAVCRATADQTVTAAGL